MFRALEMWDEVSHVSGSKSVWKLAHNLCSGVRSLQVVKGLTRILIESSDDDQAEVLNDIKVFKY